MGHFGFATGCDTMSNFGFDYARSSLLSELVIELMWHLLGLRVRSVGDVAWSADKIFSTILNEILSHRFVRKLAIEYRDYNVKRGLTKPPAFEEMIPEEKYYLQNV